MAKLCAMVTMQAPRGADGGSKIQAFALPFKLVEDSGKVYKSIYSQCLSTIVLCYHVPEVQINKLLKQSLGGFASPHMEPCMCTNTRTHLHSDESTE